MVTEIELAHGDARLDGAPLVRVRTRRANPEAPPGLAAGEAARALAMQLWHEGGAEHGAVRAAFVDDDPVASWEEARVPVAGVPTAFRRLVAGSTWVALGHVGGQLVTLFARHEPVERVRLVRIADPEPYLSGSAAP